MKKIGILFLNLLLVGIFTGCSSSSALMKSYQDTALENKSLIIQVDTDNVMDFFATDLAVFPKNANTIAVTETSMETEDTEETESESKSKKNNETETEADVIDISITEEQTITSNTVLLAGVSSKEDLYGENIYDRVYPASVTKIMTALLTMQHAKFTDTITFTEEMVVDEYGAKLCGFNVGDQLTVEQLFKGLLIYSGNDAANALAIHIGGSISGFSDMMNAEAKRLGCVDTHFVNPSGLHDNEHYTSAYDLYLIFNECLKYDQFQEVIRQNSCDVKYKDAAGETIEATYTTTNQYFTDEYDYPENVRVLGGKTGTTDEAGCCLILYDVDQKNQGYISVVLGASTYDTLYSEMNVLLNKIPK